MNDVEQRARHLIDAARAGHDPNAADAARVRAALKARVLAEPLLIEPGLAPAPAAASTLLGKLLIALGAGGALGFAAGWLAAQAFWPGGLVRPQDAVVADRPPPAMTAAVTDESIAAQGVAAKPASAESLDAIARAASSPPAPPRPPLRASSSARGSGAAPAAPDVPAPSPLKAELDGLRRAQELLYQGRPAWAIARLDELDLSGVGSVLLEERAATRAIAECRLGADGQRQADEYARRFPRSAHLERVRSSCAGAAQGGAPSTGGGTPAAKVGPTQTESPGSAHEK